MNAFFRLSLLPRATYPEAVMRGNMGRFPAVSTAFGKPSELARNPRPAFSWFPQLGGNYIKGGVHDRQIAVSAMHECQILSLTPDEDQGTRVLHWRLLNGMKIGIDSYCYHRFFGEVYPQQQPAPVKMTQEDFLRRARELGVDGVSLESCYVNPDLAYLASIKDTLDASGLDRVWAWGHPDGLEGGACEPALQDLISNFRSANAIGAKVMRIVGSSRKFRHLPHAPQLEALSRMLKEAVKAARDWDIRMAIENHIDYNSDEILNLLERVDSPFLGIN